MSQMMREEEKSLNADFTGAHVSSACGDWVLSWTKRLSKGRYGGDAPRPWSCGHIRLIWRLAQGCLPLDTNICRIGSWTGDRACINVWTNVRNASWQGRWRMYELWHPSWHSYCNLVNDDFEKYVLKILCLIIKVYNVRHDDYLTDNEAWTGRKISWKLIGW